MGFESGKTVFLGVLVIAAVLYFLGLDLVTKYLQSGFLLGIFLRGGKIYCYANFFCYAIVFGPNFKEGQKFSGGQTASGGAPLPLPCGRKPAVDPVLYSYHIMLNFCKTNCILRQYFWGFAFHKAFSWVFSVAKYFLGRTEVPYYANPCLQVSQVHPWGKTSALKVCTL